MRLLRSVVLLLPLSVSPALAQDESSKPMRYTPEDVQLVRDSQRKASYAANAAIRVSDEGMRSITRIIGVPPSFRALNVEDEQALIEHIEDLYPFLGFRDTEALRYEGTLNIQELARYRFRQYIHGIRTPHALEIDVNDNTGVVLEFRGYTVLDRGFARTPAIPYADAIDCIKARSNVPSTAPGFDAEPFYEWGPSGILEPWWVVGSKRSDGRLNASFYLRSDGQLLSTEVSSHSRGIRELGSCNRGQGGEMIFQPS